MECRKRHLKLHIDITLHYITLQLLNVKTDNLEHSLTKNSLKVIKWNSWNAENVWKQCQSYKMKFMECRTILATQLLNVKTDNLEHSLTKYSLKVIKWN